MRVALLAIYYLSLLGALFVVAGGDVDNDYDANLVHRRGLALITSKAAARTPSTVMEIVSRDEDLSTFARALESLGLDEELNDRGPFTIFAPTNEAFFSQPPQIVNRLHERSYRLHAKDLLTHHVAASRELVPSELTEGLTMTMGNGGTNLIKVKNNLKFVQAVPQVASEQQHIQTSHTLGTNGVVHKVHQMMSTPWMGRSVYHTLREKGLTEFATLVDKVGFDGYLKGFDNRQFTVFAPSNTVFAKMDSQTKECLFRATRPLDRFVANHIMFRTRPSAGFSSNSSASEGQLHSVYNDDLHFSTTSDHTVSVNGRKFVESNLLSWNGLVHEIDGFVALPNVDCGLPRIEGD